MFIEFTTTITHRIGLSEDGIGPVTHVVDIDAGHDGVAALGTQIILAIVMAGCHAAINSIETQKPVPVAPISDEEY